MATTFTTRLGLRKPDPAPVTGDLVDAAADLNANWDKVDAAIGVAICTSTTRPSTPFQGMQAYETDTSATIVCASIGPAVWRYSGTPIVASQAARNALTAYAGLRIYRSDIKANQLYDGSAWSTPSPSSQLNQFATSDLTIGTSDGDIPGAVITFSTQATNSIVKVTAGFDFEQGSSGTGYCYGSLYVNGVRESTQALFLQGAAARIPGYGHWERTLASINTYTLKLGGHKDIGSGTAYFRSAGTSIHIDVYQQ